jgi:protein MpaA
MVLLALAALVFGHSVDGRPLRALEVGDPASPTKVLVVGCIHGNECAGMPVVWRLARTQPLFDLWLVPNLNPDGFAQRTRANAHGVDLNRDFFARREPESRALRRLALRLRPAVTIWYHQPQGLVRAWGPSVAAARRFARLAGMRFAALRWPPGSASSWQNRRFPHASSFVVELPAGRLTPRSVDRQARAVIRLASARARSR